jgi:hypothetical protein
MPPLPIRSIARQSIHKKSEQMTYRAMINLCALVLALMPSACTLAASETPREGYDRNRNAAAVALAKGDLGTAIELANKAYADMPGGGRVEFGVANCNGCVVATTIFPPRRAQRNDLSQQSSSFIQKLYPEQFKAWLTTNDYWTLFILPPPALPPESEQRPRQPEPKPEQRPSPLPESVRAPTNGKYRPPLTQYQIDHPNGSYQQLLVALMAFDADLVAIAWARHESDIRMLDWLMRAQQQRNANDINRTKPLIYPTR